MSITIAAAAALFDSDGVLVDSDAAVIRSWSRWATCYSLDPDTVSAAVHGRRSRDTVELLIEPGLRQQSLEMIDSYELEDAAEVTAMPGAAALLPTLRPGYWAVVTSGTRSLATARLSAAHLPIPDVFITADDIQHGKPQPDGYLGAAHALGVSAPDTVVFEDSVSGVQAAINAKVGTIIGIGERALATAAPIVVSDLRSVHWSDGIFTISGETLRP